MDNQTTMIQQNGTPQTDPSTITRDVGEFADGVINLVELQAQLLAVDMKECSHQSRLAVIVVLSGVGLGLACFPIVLVAIALVLVQVFSISHAAAFAVTALGGFVMSAMLCVFGWFRIRRNMATFNRSRDELVRNLSWIKKVMERKRTTRHNAFDNTWRTVR